MSSNETALPAARSYASGMGQAVADRTINRKIHKKFRKPKAIRFQIPRDDTRSLDEQMHQHVRNQNYTFDGEYTVEHGDGDVVRGVFFATGRNQMETWEDVAERVAKGNSLLGPEWDRHDEYLRLRHHLRRATILLSGRHLQHGDETQPGRPQEVFTNCSTSAASFLTFYLLLNGSGVGRCYDDDMMLVDWANMPIVVCAIDHRHPDVQSGEISAPDRRTAEHLYCDRKVHVFDVPDSREGWAKAVEKIETMAHAEVYREDVLLLDFSGVRERGRPIKGMQDRPASGPGPLMNAIANVARIRDTGMAPWRQAMYIDHYLAECVLVGGARRAARMSTKDWRDPSVLDFIRVKRGGFLWSSNNSVTIDGEFRRLVAGKPELFDDVRLHKHALRVWNEVCEAAYFDGTGEPGLINQDRLTEKNEGFDGYLDGEFAGCERYQLEPETKLLMRGLAARVANSRHKMIVNPCGEIVLNKLGGYCVIGDVVPFHAAPENPTDSPGGAEYDRYAWDEEAEDAFRTTVRALMRTNLMDCLYRREVRRTNRIGVSMTGIHEYAWARFGYGWRDLVNEEKSKPFWLMLSRFKRAVAEEARTYAQELGVNVPHTDTTIKPAGTTSKLFMLTEGAHLPAMREFLRWVQFRNDDPLIADYEARGYPVKRLRTYSGTTVIGFPTQPTICTLGMGDKLVTATEATPEEQYKWLELLEKYWIRGVDTDGVTPLSESGNQVSYTLKYDPARVSFEEFKRTMLEGQFRVRTCSVLPVLSIEDSAYEYVPEEALTKGQYELVLEAIKGEVKDEDVDFVHVDCAGGACPVDFSARESTATL